MSYDLGFDEENVVYLDNKIENTQQEALESELKSIPGVKLISFVQGTPIDGGNNQIMTDYAHTGKQISFQVFVVDSNFFKMMGIEIISSGAAYDPKGIWLSESALKAIEAEGILQEFAYYEQMRPVLGVVKDFHVRSLAVK